MTGMWFAPYTHLGRSRPSSAQRAPDGKPSLVPRMLYGARSLGRESQRPGPWRWGLHAIVGALAVTPLVYGLFWEPPLVVRGGPAEAEPAYSRAAYGGDAGDEWLVRRPQLDPPAEDERSLVERISLYRTVPGDTLLELAQRFGISMDTLVWANSLADPDHIVSGQELTVLPVPGVVHNVREGETVADLAERYRVDAQTLVQANGLADPSALRVGDRLLVPNGRPLWTGTMARAVPWPAPGTGVIYRQQFIEAAAAAAQESQRRSRVPASVAIAQAIHETGWGASRLTREAHNYFGIKGRNKEGPAGVVWMNTWEVIGGRNITAREPFRAYHTPEESFLDHGTFLLENRRYHGAFAYTDDPRAFIRAIADAGFATDPVYTAKIVRMMDLYDLYQYDLRESGVARDRGE